MLLFSIGTPKVIVAEGRLVSIDANEKFDGLPIGPDLVKVLVEKAIHPNQELCMTSKKAATIGQALRKFILWPKVNVCLLVLDKLLNLYLVVYMEMNENVLFFGLFSGHGTKSETELGKIAKLQYGRQFEMLSTEL